MRERERTIFILEENKTSFIITRHTSLYIYMMFRKRLSKYFTIFFFSLLYNNNMISNFKKYNNNNIRSIILSNSLNWQILFLLHLVFSKILTPQRSVQPFYYYFLSLTFNVLYEEVLYKGLIYRCLCSSF